MTEEEIEKIINKAAKTAFEEYKKEQGEEGIWLTQEEYKILAMALGYFKHLRKEVQRTALIFLNACLEGEKAYEIAAEPEEKRRQRVWRG